MNPREYEHKSTPPVPLMPNIHPLVDKLYKPYDIGQVGQLDLLCCPKIFGGKAFSRLTRRGMAAFTGRAAAAATAAEKSTTNSLALFICRRGEMPLGGGLYRALLETLGENTRAEAGSRSSAGSAASLPEGESEQVFSTDEGPVVITTRGKLVFVAESFPLDLARKLTG